MYFLLSAFCTQTKIAHIAHSLARGAKSAHLSVQSSVHIMGVILHDLLKQAQLLPLNIFVFFLCCLVS